MWKWGVRARQISVWGVRGNLKPPIGSIVVPLWGYLIRILNVKKGTTMEPLGKP